MWWTNVVNWIDAHWLPIALILLAAYLIDRFGAMIVEKIVRRTVRYHTQGDTGEEDAKKRQDTLISLFSATIKVLVWLVAGFTILGVYMDVNLTPILAGASVLGVAVGFGAQALIKDFLSGLFIILENQYRVGDVVLLDGAEGRVEEITIRSTVLRDNDGSVHYIPNGTINHTINKTMGFAKINLTIQVDPGTDIDKLSELINNIGSKMSDEEKWKKKIIDPPHFLSISNFTPTTLEVKIIGKTQPTAQWNVIGELRKRLLTALNKDNIKATDTSAPATSAKKK